MTQEMERTARKISVVIPTFNRAGQVRRAITCVLNQTHDNVEVIVVDDGSTEDIAEVIASIDDSRIVFMRNEANKGGGYSRARGALAATGDYVAFLDSDDWWAETKLEIQLEAALSLGDPNAVFLCRSTMLFGDDVIADIPAQIMPEGMAVSEFLYCHRGLAQTSTMFLPAALAKKVTFDPELRVNQDTDFLIRLEEAGARIVQLPQSLSFFDCSPSSDRVSYNPALVGRAEAWYRARSGGWSRQAKCGFYLTDLTARAANAKKRGLALSYFARGVHPRLGLRLHVWLLAYIVAGKPPPRLSKMFTTAKLQFSDNVRVACHRLKNPLGGSRLFGCGVVSAAIMTELAVEFAPILHLAA